MAFRFYLILSLVMGTALPSAMATSLTLLNSGGQSIVLRDNPLSEDESHAVLGNLSAQDFYVFQEKRIRYLEQAYSILSKFRWFMGATKRVSRRVGIWTKHEPIISIINPSEALSEFGRSSDRTERFGNNAIRERLEFINRELWLHAPIVIRSNEFGGVFAIAPNGGAAIGNMGFYRSVSLGVAISYNHYASYIRVEILSDFEKLSAGIPGQVNAGVTLKVGAFIANRLNATDVEEHAFSNARSSYPLGPFGIEDSSTHLAAIVPVMFGIVPSPFDGFMGVQNSTTRKILASGKFQCSSLANPNIPSQ